MTPAEDAATSVVSRGRVPLHWDGMFFIEPSWQFFQCVEPPNQGSGGATVFVHSGRMLHLMPRAMRRQLRRAVVEYNTPLASYFGGYPVRYRVVRSHPHLRGREIVQLHEDWQEDLQPVNITVADIDKEVFTQAQQLSFDRRGELMGFERKKKVSLIRKHQQ